MQPVFQRQRLALLATTMIDMTAAMIDRWKGSRRARRADRHRSRDGGRVDDDRRTDGAPEADVIAHAMTMAQEHVRVRPMPEQIPTPHNIRFNRMLRTLDAIIYSIIKGRRRNNRDEGDLLSVLLAARDEPTGEGMSDKQIRDEVLTLFAAGFETTANALNWSWWLLGKFPMVGRKLRGELADVLQGRPRHSTATRGTSLHHCGAIQESMRLYPPTWVFSRATIGDDVIAGYRIPAESLVVLSPYVTHRHPEFLDNPDRFDPERFLSDRSSAQHPFVYIPFGGGPRHCIGHNFAMMEAQIVLAMVAQVFDPQLVPGFHVIPAPLVTLRPHNGMSMVLKPAQAAKAIART
jgi:cytochrome P450